MELGCCVGWKGQSDAPIGKILDSSAQNLFFDMETVCLVWVFIISNCTKLAELLIANGEKISLLIFRYIGSNFQVMIILFNNAKDTLKLIFISHVSLETTSVK